MSEVTRRPVSSPVEEAEKEMEEEHQEKGVNNTFLEDGESKATQVEPKKGGFFSRLKGVLSPTVEGATPLNKTIIGVVFLSLFSSSMTITFIFPFMPELVLYYGYKEEEKGYYAGMVAAALFVGRAVGSYFWGWLSDKKGRKPILLITIFGNGLATLIFGFAQNIWVAVFTRLMTGIANGAVGTCKVILYEVSDNTNQALAMSAIGMAWGLGLVIGPTIGGYLSFPSKYHPGVFPQTGLFHEYPVLLASCVPFVVAIFTCVIILFKLPETLNTTMTAKNTECDETKEEKEPLKSGVNTLEEKGEEEEEELAEGKGGEESHADSVELLSGTGLRQRGLPNNAGEASPAAEAARIRKLSLSENHLHWKQRVVGNKPERMRVLSESDTGARKLSQSDARLHRPSLRREGSHEVMTKSILHLQFDIDIPYASGLVYREDNRGGDDQSNNKGEAHDHMLPKTNGGVAKAQSALALHHRGETGSDVSVSIQEPSKEKKEEEEEDGDACCCARWRCCRWLSSLVFVRLMRIHEIRLTVLLYTLHSFGIIAFEELFTVWASTDTSLGGIAFTTSQLGTVIGVTSIPLLFLGVIIFSKFERHFGIIRVFQGALTIVIFLMTICPGTRFLINHPAILWVVMLTGKGILSLVGTLAFTSTGLLINNSCTPQNAGTVNGVGMTMTAIARSVAPLFGGSVFAWSISHGVKIGFPFDVNLAFILLGGCCYAAVILSTRLPESLNRQKK